MTKSRSTESRSIAAVIFSAVSGLAIGCWSGPAMAQNFTPGNPAGKPVTIVIDNAGEQDQEIELLDRSGQKIKGRLSLALPQQDNSGVDLAEGDAKAQRMRATMLEGRFFIEAEDGSQKEIQPQSVSVSKFNRTIIDNGQEKTEIVEQTIITDAQGNRYEVETPDNQTIFGFSALPNATAFSQVAPDRFMIGIQMEPVAPPLTAQLNLEPGVGLMISQILPESPAAKAGLQIYDIVLYAENSKLRSASDLTGLVQKAGQAGESLGLVLVRGGQEMSAEVLPVERTLAGSVLGGDLENGFGGGLGMIEITPFPMLNFQHAGPGIILDQNIEMDVLLEQLRNLEHSARQRAEQFRGNPGDFPDARNFRLQAQQAVEEMRQRVAEFESRSENQAQEMNELMRNMKTELEELRKLRNRDN